MADSPYLYQPRIGVLSGDSFEKQTEAFFADLDQRVKTLSEKVDAEVSAITARLDALEQQLQGALDTLNRHEGRLDAAETAIQQLAQAVAAMKPHLTPDGLIAITSGQTPDGWSVCDGLENTPDLSDYAVAPLTYIRKKS